LLTTPAVASAQHESMQPSQNQFSVATGGLLQLSSEDAAAWVQAQLNISRPLQVLHRRFVADGFAFYVERAKVFVHSARDLSDTVRASVLGILPSFVPATAADPGHPAVGISIHDSGYAIAAGVNVSHRPFGVTDFTLYELNPNNGEIVSSSVSLEDLVEESIDDVALRLGRPTIPDDQRDSLRSFTVMSPADQGMLIGSVIQQLLEDNLSRAFFPPEYAQALNLQTPAFQKFAFATRQRFLGTMTQAGYCTSTSTSCNVCTSTSTSTSKIIFPVSAT
jgi:hypothetical protein